MDKSPGGGLPVRAALHPTGLYLMLRDIAPRELHDPFMQQTVVRIASPDRVVHVPRSDLGKAAPGSAPAGIIFHVSRCGSTLLSQLLKQHENLVVYGEPLPVSEILLPPHTWPRHDLVGALRSLGAAFAAHARGPYVLKLTSWNTLFCDMLAEAFPTSPWVFNYRDPVEVGVSLLKEPAGWFAKDSEPYHRLVRVIDPLGVSRSSEEDIARLYGAFCTAALRLNAGQGKLVSYADLPAAAWDIVAPHFSLALDDAQKERMAEAARTYSKAPRGEAAIFESDTEAKQSAASPALRRAIDTYARPALDALQARTAS